MQIAGDQVAWEMELGLIPRQIISEPVSFRHSFRQVCIKGEPRKLQQARMRSQILPTEVSLGFQHSQPRCVQGMVPWETAAHLEEAEQICCLIWKAQ